MTKPSKSQKLNIKSKAKGSRNYQYDEEMVSLKEIQRDRNHKRYRNYENVLKTKDVSALLQYEED
jgi:hypothetical protein